MAVQRAEAEIAPVEPADEPEGPEAAEMDYDRVAEEVYKRLRRQLQIERERQHGVG